MGHGVGYQVDVDFAALGRVGNAVHGQAHAVDGDRAFIGQVLAQSGRCQHAQVPALAHLRKVGDRADTVHMAGDQMPAQPVVGAQGFFQIDRAGGVHTSGFVQRFG